MILLIFFAVLFPLLLWRTFIFKQFWLWFVVPMGVQPVSLIHAFGLLLIFDLFFKSHKQLDNKRVGLSFVESFLNTLFLFFLGYIAHKFMPLGRLHVFN